MGMGRISSTPLGPRRSCDTHYSHTFVRDHKQSTINISGAYRGGKEGERGVGSGVLHEGALDDVLDSGHGVNEAASEHVAGVGLII